MKMIYDTFIYDLTLKPYNADNMLNLNGYLLICN